MGKLAGPFANRLRHTMQLFWVEFVSSESVHQWVPSVVCGQLYS